MVVAANALNCVGINVLMPSPKSHAAAGFSMAFVPGSSYPKGSVFFENDRVRWVSVKPFWISKRLVSVNQYMEIMGNGGSVNSSKMSPVGCTKMSALEYLRKRGEGVRLPTDDEYELAARGPAVNIPKLMKGEKGQYNPADVIKFVEKRFENFVIPREEGDEHNIIDAYTRVYRPDDDEFQKAIRVNPDLVFYGWRMFATNSGRLTPEEAWLEKVRPPMTMWGENNPWWISGMAGGLGVWVEAEGDVLCARGGSYLYTDEKSLVAAKRWEFDKSGDGAEGQTADIGIRPAANFSHHGKKNT